MEAMLHKIAFALAGLAVAGLGLLLTVCGGIALVKGTTRRMVDVWKRIGWTQSSILIAAAVLGTIYGGSKMEIKPRSSADEGITLQTVIAINTNGVTRISATSTGASAQPMYYRDSTTNNWTLATADGFTHEYSGMVGGIYSNAWSRAEEEFTPKAMYWFGDNPPPVEIIATDGIFLDAWRGTGRGVEVDWHIADDVEIADGSTVILEYAAGNAAFETAAEQQLSPGGGRSGTMAVQGWFVGHATRWRLKLEVPQ
jgi:hypothetical protein